MTKLKLRLDINDLFSLSPSSDNRIVANIYPISNRKMPRDERQQLKSLLIPAGAYTQNPPFYEKELEPGRYYVEAVLPSEEIIGKEIEIIAGQAELELRLESSSSPHEWMSWQRFGGNVARSSVYHQRVTDQISRQLPQAQVKLVTSSAPFPGQQPDYALADGPAWLAQGFFFANRTVMTALREGDQTGVGEWLPGQAFQPPCIPSQALHAELSDPLSDLYVFDSGKISSLPGLPYLSEGTRSYLFLNGPGLTPQYCVVPLPWHQVDFSGEARVQVLVQRDASGEMGLDGSDQGFRLSVVVEESKFASLIAYLGARQMQAAGAVLGDSVNFLFGKMVNPLAAAAGAYVLLGTPDAGRPTYWHDWVRNLMNYFAWMPDGAIQYGRLLLSKNPDSAAMLQARGCYLEGFRRGLPFFSKGVEYLLEGLTRFANLDQESGQTDPTLEQALKITRDLALRTNIRQPFTTVLMD